MPGYIGYTPQFDPISLQDYLTVPTMVLSEYAKAEDAYNETANKAEAIKALLGERNADNEAGWRIIDNYERQLGDIASNIANGIQGPEAYRQARGASRYYRENILPLEAGIPAYQKELEKYNADPSMIGARPALENYIKNPLYRGYMLSGDKIYTDMVNQGKMVAADRSATSTRNPGITGYFEYVESAGYSPEEQQEYYNLVNAAFTGDETATRILQSNAKYSQLYQGLVSYMMDHNFNDLDDNSRYSAFDRAVSGQLHGMTGTSTSTLVADKAWEHNSRMAAARASSRQAGTQTPSSYSELYEQKKARTPNIFGTPVSRPGQFSQDVQVNRRRGNIITQEGGRTVIKDRRGILEALHLNDMLLTDEEYNYFIDNNGFKSLEDLQARNRAIQPEIARLVQQGGHGPKRNDYTPGSYTKEDKRLMREGQILQRLINNSNDYQKVISQFNELGVNYSLPQEQVTVPSGLPEIPFIGGNPETISIDRLGQMIAQANMNLQSDANLQRLGLTQTGIGTIKYPLNAESVRSAISTINEGGIDIYGINSLNVNRDGDITPSLTRLKLKNLTSDSSGKTFTGGALYNVPDADAFILYITDDKGEVYNFWIPGTQIDPNYDNNFNIAFDNNRNKVKFSQIARQYSEADEAYRRAVQQYNANKTAENFALLEQAAQLANMAYDTYIGNIQNRDKKMLNTSVYRTAGTYDENTATARKAFTDNVLDTNDYTE